MATKNSQKDSRDEIINEIIQKFTNEHPDAAEEISLRTLGKLINTACDVIDNYKK